MLGSERRRAAGFSGGDALVVMMQAAEILVLDNAAAIGGLDPARFRAVHVERLMRAPMVVVVEVVLEDPLKVPLVHDDHVIEAISPDRADEPLDEGIGMSSQLHGMQRVRSDSSG